MKNRREAMLTVGALGAAAMMQGQAPAPPKTTAAKTFRLSDYKGKSGVVVAFFPAAFTGGCTKEITAYGNELAKFKEMGFEVIGISTDNIPSLAVWQKEMLKVDAPLGSDFATRKTAEAYGVLMKDRGMANRATFVVDRDGKITHIVNACSRMKGK